MRAVDTAPVFLSCGPCRSWTAPWSASTAACCSPSRVVCLHKPLCSGRRNCMWILHVMTCLHQLSPWQLISHVLHLFFTGSSKDGRLLNSGWPPSPACGPPLHFCLQGTWNGRQSMCHCSQSVLIDPPP